MPYKFLNCKNERWIRRNGLYSRNDEEITKGADKGKNEASPDGKPILGHRQEVTGKKARMKPRKER
jgi:hypothetical protein